MISLFSKPVCRSHSSVAMKPLYLQMFAERPKGGSREGQDGSVFSVLLCSVLLNLRCERCAPRFLEAEQPLSWLEFLEPADA